MIPLYDLIIEILHADPMLGGQVQEQSHMMQHSAGT
jgi:hypothetical protein